MTGLADRRLLVVGGGSGIGRAVVDAYLESGARPVVVERSEAASASLAESLGERGEVVVGDGTDPAVLAHAVDRAVDRDGRLDHLTCCVGVFDSYVRVSDLSADDLARAADEIWQTNVVGTLLAVRCAVDALRAGRGSVTLTLSESAFHPVGGGVLYGASKWALRGVVTHLAAELAPDVRVNGVAPGGTSGTSFGGLSSLEQTLRADTTPGRDGRIAAGTLLEFAPEPRDHAGAYAYLADPVAARAVTGIVVNSDGGRRM